MFIPPIGANALPVNPSTRRLLTLKSRRNLSLLGSIPRKASQMTMNPASYSMPLVWKVMHLDAMLQKEPPKEI